MHVMWMAVPAVLACVGWGQGASIKIVSGDGEVGGGSLCPSGFRYSIFNLEL